MFYQPLSLPLFQQLLLITLVLLLPFIAAHQICLRQLLINLYFCNIKFDTLLTLFESLIAIQQVLVGCIWKIPLLLIFSFHVLIVVGFARCQGLNLHMSSIDKRMCRRFHVLSWQV